MLDLGWQELLVIGALALIVVGPKDLPSLLRTLGQYAGKVRGMARDFQRTMDDAARESDLANLKEIKDLGNDIRKATKFDFEEQGRKAAESLANPPKTANPIDEFEKLKTTPEPAAPAAQEMASPAPEPATEAPKLDPQAPVPEPEPTAETPKT
ncbi:MAG: Sec-independent protein translocase protein TatB [Pseudomonadota bacterium]